MSATLADFASILKEFYLGPVQEQLNNEVLVLEIMQKMSVDWNGRLCHIPLHVGRGLATSVQFAGEAPANLPVSSNLARAARTRSSDGPMPRWTSWCRT